MPEYWRHVNSDRAYCVFGESAKIDPVEGWRILAHNKGRFLFYCTREKDMAPLAVVSVEGVGLVLLKSPMPSDPSSIDSWWEVDIEEGIHHIYWSLELPQQVWARPMGEFLDGRFERMPVNN